jgi:hypothetical protein
VELYRLLVDNRDGPAHALVAGGLRWSIAAGEHKVIMLPAPTCAAQAPMTLDGEEIGALPFASGDASPPPLNNRLLDPSGRRCYQMTTVEYGIGDGPPPITEDVARGHKLYALEREVTDFLAPSPSSVEISGNLKRTSLLEHECK